MLCVSVFILIASGLATVQCSTVHTLPFVSGWGGFFIRPACNLATIQDQMNNSLGKVCVERAVVH